MIPGFVFVHGLPGAGKSTLCQRLTRLRPDVYYADVAASPVWGEVEMWRICADLYLQEGRGRWLVSEGVTANRRARDSLVTHVVRYIKVTAGIDFDPVHIVYLADPGSVVLSSRRPRTVEQYEQLRATIQYGSEVYPYTRLESRSGEPVEVLAERFSQALESWSETAGRT